MNNGGIFAAVIALLLVSCNASDTNIAGSYEVTDVKVIADDIDIGESVRTEIFFDTKVSLTDAPDGLDVVVRLSSALRYAPGSSRIYDSGLNDTDRIDPTQIQNCSDGRTFLEFRLSDSDLKHRSINGLNKFGLRFEVVGATPNASAQIEAAAAKDQQFSCSSDFDYEANDTVEVL